jgi:hypothetical protein
LSSHLKLWGCLPLVVGLTGCFGTRFPGIDDRCDGSRVTELGGQWRFSGSGSRTSCTDQRYLGHFDFRMPEALAVVATNSSDGDSAAYSLATPKTGFSLSGELHGGCFTAQVTEALPAGDSMRFEFSAEVFSGSRHVQGSFEGSGPEACVTEGSFDLEVTSLD